MANPATSGRFRNHLWKLYLALTIIWIVMAGFQVYQLVSGNGSTGSVFALVCAVIAGTASGIVSVVTYRARR
jgi:hypothetical protein